MDNFKITLYEEASGQPFPPYEHLDDERCRRLRERLAAKLGISDASPSVAFLRAAHDAQRLCRKLNAEQPDFTLDAAFAACGIVPGKLILINWWRFDNIDRMETSFVSKHFDDLWFPRADYINILDEELAWVMSVDYEGYIWCLDNSMSEKNVS